MLLMQMVNRHCLRRQDWPQVPSKSTENLCAGMQDADAETARGDIQRSAFYNENIKI